MIVRDVSVSKHGFCGVRGREQMQRDLFTLIFAMCSWMQVTGT